MSESESRETVADIVAEMRRGTKLPGYWRSCDLNEILKYHADRIEAAWKRESAVGNAAAMREALELCVKEMCNYCRNEAIARGLELTCVDGCEAYKIAQAALAAPARNCDLYATATEALKAQDVAFNEDNFKNGECRLGCPGCDDGLIDCKILWLLAPAAERKGDGDESK